MLRGGRLNRDSTAMCENFEHNMLLFNNFDLLVAGGTHKGTVSFQRDQSAPDSCTWGTSPLFRALLPCQTLFWGAALSQIENFPEQRESLSFHCLLVRPGAHN